jgi:hypothetical protein
MRKFVMLAVIAALSAFGLVAGAQAHGSPHRGPAGTRHDTDPPAKHHPRTGSDQGRPYARGYTAVGTLVSASLTPANGHHRYSGTIVVDVTRATHRAPTGPETFTLTDARVRFHHGVDPSAPAPGSRVGLHGSITGAAHGSKSVKSTTTPTVTVRHVDIRAPKPTT